MANLYFPQLASGSLAQYPIRKAKLVRTVDNVLPDGSMVLYSDPNGAITSWELVYEELAGADLAALQAHFDACQGSYRGFTFIDPTGNMLSHSTDMTNPVWLASPGIRIFAGTIDPFGGAGAFTVANAGQTDAQITQSLAVPANYQYCFSVYVRSTVPATIAIGRSGIVSAESDMRAIGSNWTRVISTGRLNDPGTTVSVLIDLAAGQQVQLYGPQLEAQIAPSRYRPTAARGGIYPNAHWAIEEFAVIAEGPDLFSTAFTIETAS